MKIFFLSRVFKNLEEYFRRVQWSIDHVKQIKPSNTQNVSLSGPSTSQSPSKSGDSRSSRSNVTAINSYGTSVKATNSNGFTYADIVNQIKQEKKEFEIGLESFRRNSNLTHCSVSSTTSTRSVASNLPTASSNNQTRTSRKSTAKKNEDRKSKTKEVSKCKPAIKF